MQHLLVAEGVYCRRERQIPRFRPNQRRRLLSTWMDGDAEVEPGTVSGTRFCAEKSDINRVGQASECFQLS